MEGWQMAIVSGIFAPLLVGFIQTVVLRPLQALPGKVDGLVLMLRDLAMDLEDAHDRIANLEAQRTGNDVVRPTRRRRSRRSDFVSR